MSFQTYLDTIRETTGKNPDDWRAWADAKGCLAAGLLRADVRAGAVVADLKDEFGLDHGHTVSLAALLTAAGMQTASMT